MTYRFNGKLKFENSFLAQTKKSFRFRPVFLIQVFTITLILSAFVDNDIRIMMIIAISLSLVIYFITSKSHAKNIRRHYENHAAHQKGFLDDEHLCFQSEYIETKIKWPFVSHIEKGENVIHLFGDHKLIFSLANYMLEDEGQFDECVKLIESRCESDADDDA